ncbi:hypothetical protein RQP46_007128 [Phenoliferia psychrophenolica]
MPSPFSCFSPSYTETLPRSYAAANPHSALAQLNADFGSNSRASVESRARSVDFVRGQKQSNTTPVGLPKVGIAQRALKRRSYGPGGDRRLTKDLIGLPTNFVHEGHVGRPLSGAAAADLTNSLASVAAALDAPNLSLPSSPSFPTHPLPSTTQQHSHSLPSTPLRPSFDSTPTPSPNQNGPRAPPHTKLQRKAPPPVTASVIRQAGPEAVFGRHAPAPPPLPLPLPTLQVEPLGVPSPSVILGERQPQGKEGEADEMGRRTESDVDVEGGAYETGTAKKRVQETRQFEATMADIEAALLS